MQVVIVNDATYRGETITGTFRLVQGFTAFAGDVEKRRNGRKGTGFIKVMPEGETLSRLAPNLAKPVKLTVAAENEGYMLGAYTGVLSENVTTVESALGLPAGVDGSPAVAVGETFTPEFGVDAERELATAGQLVSALDELRAAFAAATGRERDNLRKRLRRMEAKVAN